MLRRTAFCFHYYLKLNITHTSDIVVKRPRKASAGIQSHGILTFVEEKKNEVAFSLCITPYQMHDKKFPKYYFLFSHCRKNLSSPCI